MEFTIIAIIIAATVMTVAETIKSGYVKTHPPKLPPGPPISDEHVEYLVEECFTIFHKLQQIFDAPAIVGVEKKFHLTEVDFEKYRVAIYDGNFHKDVKGLKNLHNNMTNQLLPPKETNVDHHLDFLYKEADKAIDRLEEKMEEYEEDECELTEEDIQRYRVQIGDARYSDNKRRLVILTDRILDASESI